MNLRNSDNQTACWIFYLLLLNHFSMENFKYTEKLRAEYKERGVLITQLE